MTVAFTAEELTRIRHHMGYPDVTQIATYNLGVPSMMETQFMIEGAVTKLTDTSIVMARQFVCQMDAVERSVYCGMDLADVMKVDTIELNPKRLVELAKYYKIAQEGLANLLGIVANPFDQRSWLQAGCINVPVTG